MTLPLMPKATAVWLVENTALTFEQIAALCGMHPLEVQGIADGEVAIGIVGLDPIANNQLTREEIARCEADRNAQLTLLKVDLPEPMQRPKGAKYTPVSKRQDRPAAIAWLLRHHPELADAQVGKLVGTTKPTIQKIRDRSHFDMANIKPTNPVVLGLCSQDALDEAINRAARIAERRRKDQERAARKAAKAASDSAAAEAAAKAEA
ncbi:MAG: DUF1013 domain-containing protein [Alphaproteobacteria bacterium]|nr:DUF1013 domain-containing protein [Alphaproteobacteria bacterium]